MRGIRLPVRCMLPVYMRAAPLFLLSFLASSAFSQPAAVPEIVPGGIVNAASYRDSVTPGSIVSVFGHFPVSSAASASNTPLPFSLAGLEMKANAVAPAPLFFAAGQQANVQLPWELSGQPNVSLTAIANGLSSAPAALDLIAFAPAIFSVNQQGTGQGAIVDTSYRLVDSLNPATPGITVVQIFCTGLGAVTNRPPTGSVASGDPLSSTSTLPTVSIGGAPAQVLYSGLAPGLVGAYQVNAVVPAGSTSGDEVPVTVSAGGYTSNTVTIAVRAPAAAMDPDQRASRLLAQMTLDEKLQLVRGRGGPVTNIIPLPRGAAGWVQGISRLGIPDLYLVDGSVGVGNGVGPATALPSSIASAATWDLNQAYRYGKVIGAEMRAYGVNVESRRQCQPDRARAARRPHLRNQGRGSRPGRPDHRRPSACDSGPACHRGPQTLRAQRSGNRPYHRRRAHRRTRCERERPARIRDRPQGLRRAIGYVLLQPGQRLLGVRKRASAQ